MSKKSFLMNCECFELLKVWLFLVVDVVFWVIVRRLLRCSLVARVIGVFSTVFCVVDIIMIVLFGGSMGALNGNGVLSL